MRREVVNNLMYGLINDIIRAHIMYGVECLHLLATAV